MNQMRIDHIMVNVYESVERVISEGSSLLVILVVVE